MKNRTAMKCLIPISVAAVAAMVPSSAYADTNVRAEATCTTFTIHIDGLQPGDKVFANQGSTPPYHLTVTAEGTVDATLAAAMNPWFTADVLLIRDGQLTTVYHALVDCTTPEYVGMPVIDPAPVTTATPEPAPVVERPRRIADRLTLFGLR
jgi:hypothetical protein